MYIFFPNALVKQTAKTCYKSIKYQYYNRRDLLAYLNYLCPFNQLNIFFMISFFRSTHQMYRLIFLPRNIPNKYYFSGTAPFDNGAPPSSSTPTNQNLDLSKSQKQQSGSAGQSSGNPSERETISEVGQKAIWASAIINHILKSGPPKTIQKSLRDEILELTIPTSHLSFSLDDKYRSQIMAYFKQGIIINPKVYNQERVQYAKFGEYTRFFPTNSVSKKVFEIMAQTSPNILLGSFGIGKTFSIILFIELAKHVNRLKYLSYANWVQRSKNDKDYKKQLEMLMNLNLIGNYPKYWYWSIRSQLDQKELHVMKLVRLQLDQLCLPNKMIKKLNQSRSLEQLIFKLTDEHPDSQVFPMIVIDQINAVTSCMRNWNSQVTRLKRHKIPLEQASINIVNNYKIPAQRTIPLIRQYRKLGINYILNSSFNLERELIGKISDQDKLSLRIIDHGQIKPIEIQYAKQLTKQIVKMEFLQFFLFILEQKCIDNPEIFKKFELIKKNFNSQVIQVKRYYRQLYIRAFFDEKFEDIDFQSLNENKIQEFIDGLYKKFDGYCLKQSQNRLKTFINQGTDEGVKKYKLKVIQVMQSQARECMIKGIDKLKFSASRLLQIAKQNTFAQGFASVKTYIATKQHNNQLLPCKYNQDDDSVEFDWTPKDFLQIATPIIYPQIVDQRQFYLQQPFKQIVRDKIGQVIGFITQYWIRILISNSPTIEVNTLTILTDQPYKQKQTFTIHGIYSFLIFNEQLPTNQKIEKFRQKNPTTQKYQEKTKVRLIGSLKRNLSKLLQMAQKDPANYYFGIPVSKDSQYDMEKNAPQSQGIDMILVKYNQGTKIFEITTIDSTIKKKIGEKTNKAQNLLKRWLKKVPDYAKRSELKDMQSSLKNTDNMQYIQEPGPDTNQYKINHVFICPAKSCGKPKVVIKDLLTISYFPLEDIDFPNSKQTAIYKRFLEWKRLTIQEIQKIQ